jgi:hypothetical protein
MSGGQQQHDEERVNGQRFREDEEVELDAEGLPLLAMVRKPLGDPVITVRHLSKRTPPPPHRLSVLFYLNERRGPSHRTVQASLVGAKRGCVGITG